MGSNGLGVWDCPGLSPHTSHCQDLVVVKVVTNLSCHISAGNALVNQCSKVLYKMLFATVAQI